MLVPLAALFAVAAWSPVADAQDDRSGQPAVVQQHNLDAGRLKLEVEPRELTIDGRVRLTLELTVPSDCVAALPDLPPRVRPRPAPRAVRCACAANTSSSRKGWAT